jgi:AcrR family transcriptional regulator
VAAEGCEAVTTTRVAAESGVAVGTIYRYFHNREALLLAAYDDTVERIGRSCIDHLADMEPMLEPQAAINSLIDCYLAAAESIPAHASLLREMQHLRPVAEDRAKDDGDVATSILMPFLRRYGIGNANLGPGHLLVVYTLMATLVDLYLITEDAETRANIRADLQAYALFAFSRLQKQRPRKTSGALLD